MSMFIAQYRQNGIFYAEKRIMAESAFTAFGQAQNWADLQTGKDVVYVASLVKVA